MSNTLIGFVSLFITWIILHGFSFTVIGAPAAGLLMYPFYLLCFIIIYAFVYAFISQFGRYFRRPKHSKNTLLKTVSKSFALAGKVIYTAFVTLFVVIGILILLFKYDGHKRKQASFHKSYPIHNYDDNNITYYEHPLARYSQKFVQERDKKEVFEAYVKKSIALKCIRYFLENHLDSQKAYRMQGNFDRFYRNKYAVNQELIDNTIDNIDFIDDMKNIVYIDYSITHSIYHDKVNECQHLRDVDRLYPIFKRDYIYEVQSKINSTKENKNYQLNLRLKSKVDSYKELLKMIGE